MSNRQLNQLRETNRQLEQQLLQASAEIAQLKFENAALRRAVEMQAISRAAGAALIRGGALTPYQVYQDQISRLMVERDTAAQARDEWQERSKSLEVVIARQGAPVEQSETERQARHRGYEHGVKDGWNGAFDHIADYIDPIIQNMQAVNAIAGQIIGVALAGFGDLPKKQLEELAGALMEFMARTDFAISRAAERYGDDFREQFKTDFIGKLYQAVKHYYSTGDDKPLLELAQSKNELLVGLIDLRLAMRPGTPTKEHSINEWLFEYAHRLKLETGKTWHSVAVIIQKRLAAGAFEGDQMDDVRAWAEQANPADYLRKGWSKLDKKRRSLPQNVATTLLRHSNR